MKNFVIILLCDVCKGAITFDYSHREEEIMLRMTFDYLVINYFKINYQWQYAN